MQTVTRSLATTFLTITAIAVTVTLSAEAQSTTSRSRAGIPRTILLRIVKAEDERRWDQQLRQLLSHPDAAVRERATLAAGRIGDEAAVPALIELLQKDTDDSVRAIAAFAIGEVESVTGADALIPLLQNGGVPAELRGRAIEALGKIAGALPKEKEARQKELGAIIVEALRSESQAASGGNNQTILLGLTAALRARPNGAGPTVAAFLKHTVARIRADAANTLARLRLKDGNDQLRTLLTGDDDPIVRANAARVLGATEDKASIEALIDSAVNDKDARVRVSAIRALAILKDPRAANPLLRHGETLTKTDLRNRPVEVNEVLEIATTLGRLLPYSENQAALNWLRITRNALENTAPEVEIAYARIWPAAYLSELGEGEIAERDLQRKFILNWRTGAGIAAALGEFASFPKSLRERDELAHWAEEFLNGMLRYREANIRINSLLPLHTEYGIPAVLRAYAAHKPQKLPEVLLDQLKESDVVVRATAADLIGDLPSSEINTRALVEALPRALNDPLNDAALSILDSLAKQKTASANRALKTALDSRDYLVRRRAVTLLKANNAGDFSSRIGTVKTRNTMADYQRALSRIGKTVRAVVTTTKGSFTIELLPAEAPLTVDNFVQLAQRNYFDGFSIHRVVPNFVVQDGDPRGDGSGGPGYEIRCEINEVPFDRAAVGMALSGKDTGGSQWFVTHSPQPHLDGGYTVFGQVVEGMDVVDKVVRGDVIKSIVVERK